MASGSGGFDLTDPFDCHVYLLDGGDEAALIDAGIGASAEAILAAVDAAGVERERVRHLLLTHAHPDHAGGAAALKRLLPNLLVVASPHVARVVAEGDEMAMSLEPGKRAGFYPPDYRFEPCPVDGVLRADDGVAVGGLRLTALDTPGHSAGHLAFIGRIGGRTACFCGDLLFYGGLISLEANLDCSLQQYAASVERLAPAGIDALLPGHHAVSLRRGQRHVETARRRFANGFVPPSIV